MTVIFNTILNPTANLRELVWWHLSVRCELAFKATKVIDFLLFFFSNRHHNCWSCAYLAAITLRAAAAKRAGDLTHIVFSHNHLPFLTHLGS